jgi:hypothetical protein
LRIRWLSVSISSESAVSSGDFVMGQRMILENSELAEGDIGGSLSHPHERDDFGNTVSGENGNHGVATERDLQRSFFEELKIISQVDIFSKLKCNYLFTLQLR